MSVLQEELGRALEDTSLGTELFLTAIQEYLDDRGIRLGRRQQKLLHRNVSKALQGDVDDDGQSNAEPSLVLTDLPGGKTVELGPDEWDELMARVSAKARDLVPTLITKISPTILEATLKHSPRILRSKHRSRRRFEHNLRSRWGRALDLFEIIAGVALESGAEFNDGWSKIAEAERDYVFYALVRLHARACQVATEVSTLSRSGLADGAHARWRTLHELAVVAYFLKLHGNDTAESYLEHATVESLKAACQYQENAAALQLDPLAPDTIPKLEEQVETLIKKYGPVYKKQYGWAAPALKKKQPTFAELEKHVNLDTLRPYYKLASHNVHAGPKGITYRLGLMEDNTILLAGPSNAGLAEPLGGAAVSLIQVTSTLLTHKPNIDQIVTCNVLFALEKDLRTALSDTHHQLIEDHKCTHGTPDSP